MSNLTLHLDKKAEKNIEQLKEYYGATTKAEVIRKGLALLKIATEIKETKGELIARKDGRESQIIIT